VDVRDHTRRHASEGPADDGERSFLRTLREHRVRPEAAQLTRNSHRQQGVEDEPVQSARADGSNEREARIPPAPSARARENTHVELGGERVELLLERGRERQRVPRAADQQEPLPHGDAAFSSSASMVVKIASSE
jgi:hypothetical protein